MGNLLQDELAADAAEIISEIGHSADWKGTTYNCLIGDPDVNLDLEAGGFLPGGSFQIKFLRADFNAGAGPFPADNDRITYGGKVYHTIGTTNKVGSPYIIATIVP